jgi:hypothetical protein
MKNKKGILVIMLPLKTNNGLRLLSNPFIRKGFILHPEKLKALHAQINVDFPTADFKNRLALDIVERDSGTSIVLFKNMPPLQYRLGSRSKVAVIATGVRPLLRSFSLNGTDLSGVSIPTLPLSFNEYLFAHSELPHIINITPGGEIFSISPGHYIENDEISIYIRRNIMKNLKTNIKPYEIRNPH